ncbi:MAG TPA: PAS domain-containing sensor histidine kinase [Candidatus Saccharimonadales bacterium]
MLTLLSQLTTVSERSAVAKLLAAKLEADDFIIFIRDGVSGVFLPAPGFDKDSIQNETWQHFLDRCTKTGTYSTTIPKPDHQNATIKVTVLSHHGRLAIAIVGDHPSEKMVAGLRQLLPLLATVFHYEQSAHQSNRYVQQAEASVTAHRNITRKLDIARKSLQAALAEKENEIHERIKSEAALAESEGRFRFMAESLSTMIFTARPDGKLDYVSPRWEAYTGIPTKTILAQGLGKILHPTDAKHVVSAWLKAYKTGETIAQEVRIKRADGIYHWHLSRADAMRNEKGEVTMWVGSSTDIEDVKINMQKKSELEERTEILTRQQHDLLELNAAKDEFIRLASHQLRTPATGVKMYIGMLMGGYADEPTETQMKMLDQAYTSNDRQLQIIDDLLKVATVDAGKVLLSKETCSLELLIKDVIDELRHTLGAKQQNIVFIPPHEPIKAEVDRRFIRMVIENLIDNASKYSGENTTITVSVARKGMTEITIIDQGVGIAKKDQALLFKKFSRIHNAMSISASGTGLGLYWAKEIITLHGGTITLNSKLHHGSTFTIQLP